MSLFRYLGGADGATLPVPMMNVINGGAHADNSIDLQEFMLVPAGAPTLRGGRCGSAPRSSTRCKALLHERGLSTAVGDEGGFAPDLELDARRRSRSILEAAERAGHRDRGRDRARPRVDRVLRRRPLPLRGPRGATAPAMADFYAGLAERYPIVSIEDGLAEDDWDGWRALDGARSATACSSSATTSSSPTSSGCSRGIDEGVGNAILSRSTRSGRSPRRSTRSSWRAAAATRRSCRTARARPRTRPSPTSPSRPAPGQIKTGAPSRTDRVAKYNQLLRIEEELGDRGRATPGWAAFPRVARSQHVS